ncbi:MAG: flagellar basal body rod protein FlgB [Nitrospinae bacterium]|nr:flagellar basal body rod protein FlgB [Nitrospinota bacterium]
MNHPIGTQALSDRTTTLLARLLDLRMERHTLIASNIANAETPRYQAADIEFEAALKSAMALNGSPAPIRTHPRHLPVRWEEGMVVSPTLAHRNPRSGIGYDLNSVDLDTEMTQLAQNNLLYNATAQLLAREFTTVRLAIEGGR